VVVEPGLGLGTFSGANIGVADEVRALTARGLRRAIESVLLRLRCVRLIIFALPVPRLGKQSYHYFVSAFEGV